LSFYPADLARIHDEGFGDFARAAACELLARQPASGLVVELGCGTGISSQLLLEAGYDVLGVDLSEGMLAIARARAPRGEFRQGSIWDAALPRCAAVTAIGEVINYAADPRAGAEELPGLFARVHAALEPGGLFLFDFAAPGRGGRPPQVFAGEGWRLESTGVEHDGTLERRMTIEAAGSRREELHRLRLYEPGPIVAELDALGFQTELLDRYCDFEFWPGYAAVAAVSGR
jgi:SAM-dependent methyltransferase